MAETAVQDSAPRPSAQTSGTAGDEAASGEAPRYQPEPAADPDPARPVFNMAPFQSPVGAGRLGPCTFIHSRTAPRLTASACV